MNLCAIFPATFYPGLRGRVSWKLMSQLRRLSHNEKEYRSVVKSDEMRSSIGLGVRAPTVSGSIEIVVGIACWSYNHYAVGEEYCAIDWRGLVGWRAGSGGISVKIS